MPLQTAPYGLFYELIINNCHMFLGDNVMVEIVSQLDRGSYKAHVLVTDHGKRSPAFSSAASSTLQAAIEDLHDKSAQAVSRYIGETGFDAVPRITTRSAPCFRGGPGSVLAGSPRQAPLEETEVIFMDESSSSSDDSDASDTEEPLKTSSRPCFPRTFNAKVGATNMAGKAPGEAPVSHRLPPPRQGSAVPNYSPLVPSLSCSPASRRPLAHSSGSGVPLPPAFSPRPPPPQDAKVRRAPALSQGPGPRFPAVLHKDNAKTHDFVKPSLRRGGFMLCVDWVGHDKLHVLDQCTFSQASLRAAAVNLVLTRMRDFQDVSDADIALAQQNGLTCTIVGMQVGGTTYQLANFPDDLSALYTDSSSCPRVEFQVMSVSVLPSPGPAATEPARLASVDIASSVSSVGQ